MAPLKATSSSSSQVIASRSRWLVGSSRNSTSGLATSARASATRFFVPPDRPEIARSGSRCRRCKVSSTRCSQFQPLRDSMKVIKASRSSPSAWASKRSRAALTSARPSLTVLNTVASVVNVGSWGT